MPWGDRQLSEIILPIDANAWDIGADNTNDLLKLFNALFATGGHNHSGIDGMAPKLFSYNVIYNVPPFDNHTVEQVLILIIQRLIEIETESWEIDFISHANTDDYLVFHGTLQPNILIASLKGE